MRPFPFKVAKEAEDDLIGIWRYVAEQNPRAADALLDRFDRRWRLLSEHPLSGPPRDDVLPGLRHLVVGAYLTLYRVSDGRVEILRVLHGARDLADIDAAPDPQG
ncbi:MAG: plasmid stabilization protein [Rhizobiales bacterium 65-9]|nr:type II toxin-antitoxin system RelE/ParE family toxin [Hyphomicrobiales bacterium]OJY33830.1 MAG: plasmid stabilization protein [Rhizobiales bacterium 65-9]